MAWVWAIRATASGIASTRMLVTFLALMKPSKRGVVNQRTPLSAGSEGPPASTAGT